MTAIIYKKTFLKGIPINLPKKRKNSRKEIKEYEKVWENLLNSTNQKDSK